MFSILQTGAMSVSAAADNLFAIVVWETTLKWVSGDEPISFTRSAATGAREKFSKLWSEEKIPGTSLGAA